MWLKQQKYVFSVRRLDVWDPKCWRCRFLLRSLYLVCRWIISSLSLPFVHICVLIPSSNEETGSIGLDPTLMNLFNLNYLFKDPISKYSHMLRYWRLGLQHVHFGGHAIQPIAGSNNCVLHKRWPSILCSLHNHPIPQICMRKSLGKWVRRCRGGQLGGSICGKKVFSSVSMGRRKMACLLSPPPSHIREVPRESLTRTVPVTGWVLAESDLVLPNEAESSMMRHFLRKSGISPEMSSHPLP